MYKLCGTCVTVENNNTDILKSGCVGLTQWLALLPHSEKAQQ